MTRLRGAPTRQILVSELSYQSLLKLRGFLDVPPIELDNSISISISTNDEWVAPLARPTYINRLTTIDTEAHSFVAHVEDFRNFPRRSLGARHQSVPISM